MKKAMLLTAVCFLLSTSFAKSENSFNLESQNLTNDNGLTTTLTGFFQHSFNKQVGMFSWFYTNKYWAESYSGPTLSPTPFCQLGIGLGLEQSKKTFRIGGFIWLGGKTYQTTIILENGHSGFWYRTTFNKKLSHFFGIGVMSETNLGIGPRIEINIPKIPIQIWLTRLFKKKHSTYLSLKINL